MQTIFEKARKLLEENNITFEKKVGPHWYFKVKNYDVMVSERINDLTEPRVRCTCGYSSFSVISNPLCSHTIACLTMIVVYKNPEKKAK